MLKRDLSYDLFSREPEDWAEWAGSARDHYAAKREPYPGSTFSRSRTPPPPPKIPLTPFNSFASPVPPTEPSTFFGGSFPFRTGTPDRKDTPQPVKEPTPQKWMPSITEVANSKKSSGVWVLKGNSVQPKGKRELRPVFEA